MIVTQSSGYFNKSLCFVINYIIGNFLLQMWMKKQSNSSPAADEYKSKIMLVGFIGVLNTSLS